MTSGGALLIAAGETSSAERFEGSLASATHIIAVDGGLRHLRAFGKAPTLVVGDLDSVKEEDLKWATENGAEIVHLPQQSESDLAKALNLCHQREWNDILVDGIEGGRHDHLLGGLAALASAHPSLNIRANLPSTKLTRFVTGFSDNITLSGTFSMFSFGTTNVTLLGPEWELNNDEVTFSTRGLSNLGNGESKLTIHSGDPLFLLINL